LGCTATARLAGNVQGVVVQITACNEADAGKISERALAIVQK
jgi:hypothetical protein